MQKLQLDSIDVSKMSKPKKPGITKIPKKLKTSTVPGPIKRAPKSENNVPKMSIFERFGTFIRSLRTEKYINRIDDLKASVSELKATIKTQNKLIADKTAYTKNLKKLQQWSKRVREVGKCDICQSEEKLTAHHLWDKKSHPTLMYQDENGVCLCEKHHNKFHRVYSGTTQVTPKMYNKFKIIEHSLMIKENR